MKYYVKYMKMLFRSRNSLYYKKYNDDGIIILMNESNGFFSCCTIILHSITHYYNTYNKLPPYINTSLGFINYKTNNLDITHDLFKNNSLDIIPLNNTPIFSVFQQYTNYKMLPYTHYNIFVKHYFQNSDNIQNIITELTSKYNISCSNTVCVYYRSGDKATETKIAPHRTFIQKVYEILYKNPFSSLICVTDDIIFEKQIIDTFYRTNVIVINELNESMNNSDIRSVNDRTYKHALYLLATVNIISKCHSIICGSGNVSLWITLLRGNATNVYQNFNLRWLA